MLSPDSPGPAPVSPAELSELMQVYQAATERLQSAHQMLSREVVRLRAELQAKNEELARKTRLAALGQMAAGVAHEVRNPLGAIRLYAGLLKRDLAWDQTETAARHTGYIQNILRAVTTMDRIVEEMLGLARTREPTLVATPLAAILGGALEAAAAQLEEHGVTVEWGSAEPATVPADAEQLRRALLNIILNAVQAMERGGRLTIDVTRTGESAAIRFADTGPGIDPMHLDRIFDPFFTGRDEGVGLGLTLVHRIVESHGGRVWAENNPDGGAAFTVVLPACQAQSANPPNTQGEPAHGRAA